MTLQEPRPSQVDPIPENVPHSGKIPVEEGGERPVDVFDKTSLLEADARGLIDYPKVDDQPQTRSDAKKSKEAKELGPVRRFIARPVGKAAVAVAGVLLAGGIGAGIKAGVDASQAQGQGTTQEQEPGTVTDPGDTTGENGGETGVDSITQMEQTVAARAEVGTAEFEAAYEPYVIKGDSPEAVITSYGQNFYAVITAACKEVPRSYYDDNAQLSLDELYEGTNPGYWKEIYSFATFGASSSELTPEQTTRLDAFMEDFETGVKQYITTASEDNPTNFENPIKEEVNVGPSTDNLISGEYVRTQQPNKNNSFAELKPEETKPETLTLKGVFQATSTPNTYTWILPG